jgi:hypothetical protein
MTNDQWNKLKRGHWSLGLGHYKLFSSTRSTGRDLLPRVSNVKPKLLQTRFAIGQGDNAPSIALEYFQKQVLHRRHEPI